jgi:hypothetical protein
MTTMSYSRARASSFSSFSLSVVRIKRQSDYDNSHEADANHSQPHHHNLLPSVNCHLAQRTVEANTQSARRAVARPALGHDNASSPVESPSYLGYWESRYSTATNCEKTTHRVSTVRGEASVLPWKPCEWSHTHPWRWDQHLRRSETPCQPFRSAAACLLYQRR